MSAEAVVTTEQFEYLKQENASLFLGGNFIIAI